MERQVKKYVNESQIFEVGKIFDYNTYIQRADKALQAKDLSELEGTDFSILNMREHLISANSLKFNPDLDLKKKGEVAEYAEELADLLYRHAFRIGDKRNIDFANKHRKHKVIPAA